MSVQPFLYLTGWRVYWSLVFVLTFLAYLLPLLCISGLNAYKWALLVVFFYLLVLYFFRPLVLVKQIGFSDNGVERSALYVGGYKLRFLNWNPELIYIEHVYDKPLREEDFKKLKEIASLISLIHYLGNVRLSLILYPEPLLVVLVLSVLQESKDLPMKVFVVVVLVLIFFFKLFMNYALTVGLVSMIYTGKIITDRGRMIIHIEDKDFRRALYRLYAGDYSSVMGILKLILPVGD